VNTDNVLLINILGDALEDYVPKMTSLIREFIHMLVERRITLSVTNTGQAKRAQVEDLK